MCMYYADPNNGQFRHACLAVKPPFLGQAQPFWAILFIPIFWILIITSYSISFWPLFLIFFIILGRLFVLAQNIPISPSTPPPPAPLLKLILRVNVLVSVTVICDSSELTIDWSVYLRERQRERDRCLLLSRNKTWSSANMSATHRSINRANILRIDQYLTHNTRPHASWLTYVATIH